jgi:hypothetical protein
MLSLPRYCEIRLSGTRKRTTDTRMSIVKKAGKIARNLLRAILAALRVFCLLAITEIANATSVTMWRYNIPPPNSKVIRESRLQMSHRRG